MPVHDRPFLRRLSGYLAASLFCKRGKALFEQNLKNWLMPLSKLGKLHAGIYLILEDYSTGRFPPVFHDRTAAFEAEIDYAKSLPGLAETEISTGEMQKPFWYGDEAKHLLLFSQLVSVLEGCHFRPPSKMLELGCGSGWMSEFLAIMGYEMTGTSIAAFDIDLARKRAASLQIKSLSHPPRFEASPMETVSQLPGFLNQFDAVFVFEALHHVFDWKQSIQSAYECLKPGGLFLICNEPNLVHTFVSYRVARLSNTHEVGMSRARLKRQLHKVGFTDIRSLNSTLHFWVRPHWLCARKP